MSHQDNGLRIEALASDRDRIKAKFKSVDKDGIGKISRDRFIAIFKAIFPSWSNADVYDLFSAAPGDAGDAVDYNAVIDWMFRISETKTRAKAVVGVEDNDDDTYCANFDLDENTDTHMVMSKSGSISGNSDNFSHDKYTSKDHLATSLAQGHTILIDGSFFVDVQKAGGILLSRQEVEERLPQYVVEPLEPEEIWAMEIEYLHYGTRINMANATIAKFLLVAVSYGWLAKGHPDPDRYHLRMLAGVLEHFLTAFKIYEKRIALFIDYGSLFQNLPGEPRTDFQRIMFQKGLKQVNLWYTHEVVQVWALTRIPDSSEYSVAYHQRGWTTFERLVSLFLSSTVLDFAELGVEDPAMLPHLLQKSGDYLFFSPGLLACKSGHAMVPPMLPQNFNDLIDGKTFTNGQTDKPFVKSTYEATFYAVMNSAESLSYGNKGWQDADVFLLTEAIKNCPNLKELTLSENKIGDASVGPCIQHCPRLTVLKLDRTEITDTTATLVANLTSLTTLSLSGTKITDASTALIARHCPLLKVLELSDTTVSDVSLSLVGTHCHGITKLNLRNTAVGDVSMSLVAQNCHDIERLHLDGTKVSDVSLCLVAHYCPNITKLNLERTHVSDASICQVAENCAGLTELQLNHTSASDASISLVAQNCRRMKQLKLNDTLVTDSSIALLAKNCLKVTALSLSNTKVGDGSMQHVAQACTKLTTLHIQNTLVTGLSIQLLAKHCPEITTLDLRNTDVDVESIAVLSHSCKHLSTLLLPDGRRKSSAGVRSSFLRPVSRNESALSQTPKNRSPRGSNESALSQSPKNKSQRGSNESALSQSPKNKSPRGSNESV